MGYKDLTNQTFGGITALERDVDLSEQKHRGWWKCRCNYCGKEVYYPTDRLQKGPYSCGCVKKPRYNFVDETGNTYGRLTVISRNTENQAPIGIVIVSVAALLQQILIHYIAAAPSHADVSLVNSINTPLKR